MNVQLWRGSASKEENIEDTWKQVAKHLEFRIELYRVPDGQWENNPP